MKGLGGHEGSRPARLDGGGSRSPSSDRFNVRFPIGGQVVWAALVVLAILLLPGWGPVAGRLVLVASAHYQDALAALAVLAAIALAMVSARSSILRAAGVVISIGAVVVGVAVGLHWPAAVIGVLVASLVLLVVGKSRLTVLVCGLALLLPLDVFSAGIPVRLGSPDYPVTFAEAVVVALFVVVVGRRLVLRDTPMNLWSTPGAAWLVLLLAGAVLAAGQGVSPEPAAAWAFVRVVCVIPALAYLTGVQVIRTPRDISLLVNTLLLGSLVLLLFVVAARLEGTWTPVATGNLRGEGLYQLWGFSVDLPANTGSMYFGIMALLSFAVQATTNSRFQRRFSLVALVAALGAMILLATRGVWLTLPFGLVLTGAMCLDRSLSVRRRVLMGFLPLAAAAAVLSFGLKDVPGISNRFQSLSSLSRILADQNVQVRLAQFPVLWRMWLEHPLGTGYFSVIPGMGAAIHNLYFFFLLGAGPLGLVSFIAFVGAVAWRARRAVRRGHGFQRGVMAAAVGSVAFVLISGFVGSGLFWRVNFGILFMLVLVAGISATNLALRSPVAAVSHEDDRR